MHTVVTEKRLSYRHRHRFFTSVVLPGVGALTDEARDEDGVTVNEVVDSDRLARFSALLLCSKSTFLGEANRLPISRDGMFEGLP